jgi:hypothetical protein
MTGLSAGSQFAVLAIVCTLAVFLFPAVRGPYAATHGPVTSMEATRVWQWPGLLLALASLWLIARTMLPFLFVTLCTARPEPDCGQLPVFEQVSILRC